MRWGFRTVPLALYPPSYLRVRDASGTGSRSTEQVAKAPVGCPAAAAAPILQRLNEQQRAAATHPLDRPLLVQAGAGTGKTTTLIARVAYTLQQVGQAAGAAGRQKMQRCCSPSPSALACTQGVPPYRMLLLTYTKRMAAEAKQRLARQRLPGADRVVCSTCHAFCFRVIRDCCRCAPCMQLAAKRAPFLCACSLKPARHVAPCLSAAVCYPAAAVMLHAHASIEATRFTCLICVACPARPQGGRVCPPAQRAARQPRA